LPETYTPKDQTQNGLLTLDEALLHRIPGVATHTEDFLPPHEGGFLNQTKQLVSSIDEALPPPELEAFSKERDIETASPLGRLASIAQISTTTGCWAIIDAWRSDKGYSYTWNPLEFGFDPGANSEFTGVRLHKIAYILHRLTMDPDFILPKRKPLDHICRFTGCCNPRHVKETSTRENNILQRKAHPIEFALAVGHLMLAPTGYDLIDKKAAESSEENTGIVVATRFGPYEVIKLDEDPLIIRGEPLYDDLLAAIRPPSDKKYQRKSRARTPKIFEGQEIVFPKTKYKKKKRPTTKDLYLDSMQAA
jgi:hypothetical protein